MRTKPKIEIDLCEVERLAAQGLTQEQIALCLGISARAYQYKKKDDAEIAAAVKRGQARGISTVTNKLFELCEEGNLGAICFYMKTRGGWSEKQQVEHSGPDGGPIKAQIDATLTPDEAYRKMLGKDG